MSIANDLATVVAIWDDTGDFQTYARAVGQMFLEVETFAEDTDTVIGWQALWDVDIAPSNALPWLAQTVGERVPSGSTDAQARSLIKAAPNQDRGTPLAIANAVKQCLTGGQTIGFRERYRDDGTQDDDALAVFTYVSETPSQNAVLAALRRTVPADIDIYYQCLSSPTWAALQTGKATWADFEAAYGPTWAAVEGAQPGYVLF